MKDIYLYDDVPVLKNKLGIKDADKLDKAEYTYASLNIASIIKEPIIITSVNDIMTIHKRLFSDVYEWAGEFRLINIYKEEPVLAGLCVNYCDYKQIDKELNKLDNEFKQIQLSSMNHKQIIEWIVKMISKLWRIHCFREGNTRTVTTFLYLYMKQIGLKVNTKFIGEHAKFFRNALVLASIDEYSEYEHLENILLDSISMKVINESKYKTIREYEVEKYEYRSHTYKD